MGLKEIRSERAQQARRFSASAVARAMNVSRPTYRQWEANPERLTHEQSERLARYLGCSVEDLFYLDEKVN